MTTKALSSEEKEDPDITRARVRDREFWLEKRAAKVGRKSVAWFRRIHRFKRPTVEDVIADRMESVFESEYAYYKWNVGALLCYLCNRRLSKKTITRDHVVPQSLFRRHDTDSNMLPDHSVNSQDNVMPCCVDCNHEKADMSLLEYLLYRQNEYEQEREAV